MITPIHKKGDKLNPDNYRRITVQPIISKLFEMTIHNRLEFISDIVNDRDRYNGGFKKGSQTADNMFILNGCIQKQVALKKPLYIAFIDFRKAFDTVDRHLLFEKLKNNGKLGRTTEVIQDMYAKTKSHIKINGLVTETFDEHLGVSQGGVLSPYLFTQFLSDMKDYLDETCGVCLSCDEILLHLLWADDLILTSSTHQNLQQQLDNLYLYCNTYKLVVNTVKTQVMVIGDKNPRDFIFNNNTIETTSTYKYVGTIFSNDTKAPFDANTDYLRQQAQKAIFTIYRYCQPFGQVPSSLACKLFDSLVSPILEYGSQIWYTPQHAVKLDKIHTHFLKHILHLKTTTPTASVLADFGRIPLRAKLQRTIINYWLRIKTLPENNLVKIVYTQLHELYLIGCKKTWCSQIVTALKEVHMDHLWHDDYDQHDQQLPSAAVVKNSIFNFYEKQLLQQIHDNSAYPKLRTYRLIKTNFHTEQFLLLPNADYRIAIARFRNSSHTLEIERGRYHRPPIPAEQRICKYCSLTQVDDEIHFLLICEHNQDLRLIFLNVVTQYIPNFNNQLTIVSKFIAIMTIQELEVINALGKFLYSSFALRNNVH